MEDVCRNYEAASHMMDPYGLSSADHDNFKLFLGRCTGTLRSACRRCSSAPAGLIQIKRLNIRLDDRPIHRIKNGF